MSRLVQSQEQKQKLNPQQILEANIMQLNSGILEKRIFEEIENNPILEFDEDNVDAESVEDNEENDFDWEELISNPEEYGIKSKSNIADYDYSVSESLYENFLSQLHDVNIKEDEIKIAEYILGNIDDAGYLSIESILITDKFNISEEKVNKLIKIIQRLDPPGIATENIQQCLSVQLEKLYPKEITANSIINDYFEDFANHNYLKVIDKINCSNEEFNNAINLIAILNPKPASNYSTNINENIIPDVVIEKQKDRWIVTTNEFFLPKLRISNSYKSILGQKETEKDAKKFIKQKIESANWFINAISNRYTTIKKVTKSIIKHQSSYFNFDKRELNPLTLKKIAEDIKMDISTISRSTNGKYAQLPWGCIELKTFFNEGIERIDGLEVSNTIIKDMIKDIIYNENKSAPLSDNDIKNILVKNGYKIARRTVAKYRESQNISVARLRRKIIE